MRVVGLVLLALVVAAPASAQTLGSPLQGKYEDSYAIYGRALDSQGLPVRGGIAMIELQQEGVTAAPLRAGINCKGDFIVEFNLLHVEPDGRVKVTVFGPDGRDNATASAPLDPFYRRNDLLVTLDVPWNQACKNEQDVWDVSASMRVRILNRTLQPYDSLGEPMHARPHRDIFRMRYEPPGGNVICAPHPQDQTPGACELFQADERGDIRYTFTLGTPFEAGGRITLTSVRNENDTWTVDIDPFSRLGVRYIEASGRGPPPELYETPAPGFALVALSVVAAMAFSRRLR